MMGSFLLFVESLTDSASFKSCPHYNKEDFGGANASPNVAEPIMSRCDRVSSSVFCSKLNAHNSKVHDDPGIHTCPQINELCLEAHRCTVYCRPTCRHRTTLKTRL